MSCTCAGVAPGYPQHESYCGQPEANGTTLVRIPTADVSVTITAEVRKLCPVKNETDHGTAVFEYRTNGQAIELHDLAEYLGSFSGTHMSHEDFTAEIAEYTNTHVTTTWLTAGMEVRCEVLREPVHTEGA
jgi:NADPH-dependent 7-cyano-7-deazaguanine reductase QueF